MATYYAVNAGGDHKDGSTWSTVSAKDASRVGDGATPTTSDDLILDDYSGSVTLVAESPWNGYAKSMDFTGYTATYTLQSSPLTIAGSLTLDTGTYSSWDGTSTVINFTGTGTITTNNVSGFFRTVIFNGASQTFTIVGNLNATYTVTIARGTLKTDGATDDAGYTHSWGKFSGGGSNYTRDINLGNSAVTITGTDGWEVKDYVSTFSLAEGTSTITLSGAGANFVHKLTDTFYNVVITGSGTHSFAGLSGSGLTWTFNNLTVTGSEVVLAAYSLGGVSLVVTGTLSLNGSSSTSRLLTRTSIPGTARTITVTGATISGCSNVDFMDITFANGGSNVDLSTITGGSGDCGGNTISGGGTLSFTTADDWYFYETTNNGTANTYNWSEHENWYTVTGGGGSQMAATRVLLAQDNCFFDANSSDGTCVVIQDTYRMCHNLDFTGVAAITFKWSSSGNCMFGSLTLDDNVSTNYASASYGCTLALYNRAATTLDTLGKNMPATYIYACDTVTLISDYVQAWGPEGSFCIWNGTFDANDQNVTITGRFVSNTTNTRVIYMGSGTWTIGGGDWAYKTWDIGTNTNLTLYCETSTIVLNYTGTSATNFSGGSQIYNNISLTGGGTGVVSILGSNTFNTFTINAPKTVKFYRGTTQIVNSFVATGSAGNQITLQSDVTDTIATISDADGGTNVNDYLDVYDIVATQENTFYYGANGSADAESTNWLATPGGVSATGWMSCGKYW